ncbi:MAG: thioredoxin family protein, partial [Acidobacteriota bacterium]
VRARIAEHWHLYSLTTPPPPKPTRIQAPEGAPFELIRVDQPALPWIKNDLDAALARAKAENKLVFVNFTGVACTNCHWMKANMFTKPAIHAAMEKFVLVELYTDELDDPRSQAFQQWQESLFQTVGIPYYAVFNPGKQLLAGFPGLTKDPAEFAAFLNGALAKI